MDEKGSQPPPPSYSMVQGEPSAPYPNQGAPPAPYPNQGSPQAPYAPPQGQYPPPQGQYPPPQGQYPPSQGQYPPPQGQYPPPQGQYPPQGPYAQHMGHPPPGHVHVGQPVAYGAPVVATRVVVGGVGMLGTAPTAMQCTNCQAHITTRTHYETGTLTWLIVGLLFIFVLWPCCLIPFCIDDLKDVVHTCPNCNAHLGRRNRM